MFSIFIKNLNLSIIAIFFVSRFWAIDFDNPQKIVGTFDATLYLKKNLSNGYTLSHQLDKPGIYKYTWYLNQEVKRVQLEVSSIGAVYMDLNGDSKLFDSNKWSTKHESFEFSQKTSKVDLEITFLAGQNAQVKKVKIDKAFHDFDENYLYKKSTFFKSQKQRASLDKIGIPFGVNLEAEYLFRELSYLEQRKILIQLKKDGFNSVRLHKVFREYQKSGGSVLRQLQRFLELCNNMNLLVYLDILSYPSVLKGVDGWKQSIFLDDVMQTKMKNWILSLSTLKVGGTALFKWSNLHYICLLNENSLYFEESEKSIDLFNRKLLERRKLKWISRESFRQDIMVEFYNRFSDLLKAKGFQKQIFLSNYQLGGKDLDLNQHLSKEVDRHLYLDYPIFYKGIVKVRNEDPIEHLKKLKKHYLSISAKSGSFISEFNLPWPNRFQHTLIPILFYLNYLRPLKGVWFYDYRLRNHDFHSGGIFGIQKFRSIIGQIPFWQSLYGSDYTVNTKDGELNLDFKDYKVRVGSNFDGETQYHYTVWTNCINGKNDFFTLEKGALDTFDSMGQIQLISGGSHNEVILPQNIKLELQEELRCY